jgi:hypothetical protein
MPELTPQSTTPPETPASSPVFAWRQSTYDPPPPLTDWETAPTFRSVFLLHFTQEGDRAALEHVGRMLYDMALAASGDWPAWIETTTRTELRAVAADIRHASLFLEMVVRERETASLDSEDERLTYAVESYVRDLQRVASGIETFLGVIQVAGR